jgi:hypothetical protein
MTARRLLALPSLLLVSACALNVEPGIEARVAQVDCGRIEAHLAALHEIGPRPKDEAGPTRATLAYLTHTLESFGYEVTSETFPTVRGGIMRAKVVPLDDPGAEPVEVPMAPGLGSAGGAAIQGASDRFREQGLRVLSYTLGGNPDPTPVPVVNLYAERRGERFPDRIVELGAHYDTVPYSPGADDNGSGVAALLETARLVATAEPAKTIRFCFYGAEENGLLGSAHHVEQIEADAGRTVEGLLNLDGVGLARHEPGSQQFPEDIPWFLDPPDTGDFITVVGNWSSGWIGNLFEDCVDCYVPELPYYSANRIGGWMADSERSDHANYWQADYDAVFLSDTTEFRAGYYHLPSDTPDTLDLPFLTQVTQATLATMLTWADDT